MVIIDIKLIFGVVKRFLFYSVSFKFITVGPASSQTGSSTDFKLVSLFLGHMKVSQTIVSKSVDDSCVMENTENNR